jgi:CBS domain-containing protein
VSLVLHMSVAARRRLAVLTREELVSGAARILANPTTPLVVICDADGAAVGVVSRTDILKVIACRDFSVWSSDVSAVMTHCILSCHPQDTLQAVWESMRSRSLRCIPILDDAGRPQGIVHARDLLQVLLEEVSQEELSLRDYVIGVGYQ